MPAATIIRLSHWRTPVPTPPATCHSQAGGAGEKVAAISADSAFYRNFRISPQVPVMQCRRWREWEGASAHYLRLPALTPIFEWFHTRFKGRNGG